MPVFVDTNVLVYAKDTTQPDKQPQARAWLDSLWERRDGHLSFQVLSEYYMNVTRQLKPGLDETSARAEVRDLLAWRPVTTNTLILEDAWAVADRYGFALWDALIVASARHAACDLLLTEDLQHGQELDGIRVVSPFRMRPEERLRR